MTLSRRTLLATGAALIATPSFAAQPRVYSNKKGAINGFDPVAYFKQGKPVEGNRGFSSSYDGATFYFASPQNKATFDANPAKYAPQYGGYCAWAVSKGYTAKTDPNAWTIYDGKLYLNYSTSIRDKWNVDKPTNVKRANTNWPKVLN